MREMKNHHITIIISRQLLYTKAFELSIFSTYIYGSPYYEPSVVLGVGDKTLSKIDILCV